MNETQDGSEFSHHHSTQICFLGGLLDRGKANVIEGASRGGVQTAANTLQWHIVDGLEANQPGNTTLVTAPFVGSFPTRYRYPIVRGWEFSHRQGAADKSIGFLNLPVVKHFSRVRGVRRALRAWVRRTPGKKVVIAYSLNYTFMKCLTLLKSLDDSIATCVIVPDLPEYMNTSKNVTALYRLLKGVEIRSIRRNFPAVDSLVLLTESMRERLPLGPSHIVMEGIASSAGKDAQGMVPRSPSRVILYAGTLNARYGILQLLEAFASINDPRMSLIICGEGDSKDDVRKAAAADARIRFLGRLSHCEVLALQSQATILINPRRNDEDFAKYSFPSKILEYMSVGRPVIAYELDGMPPEYRDYLVYVSGCEVSSLAETIRRVCDLTDDELNAMGARSQSFVQLHKNPRVQARRILNLVNQSMGSERAE